MRYSIRPYIFTASSSPSVIASTRSALSKLRRSPELRERLWRNAHRLYQGLIAQGYTLGPETSPVIAIALNESREEALAQWCALLERGVYVNLVIPPATPSGLCLLRCSLSAAHSDEQVDAMLQAFGDLYGSLAPGVLAS
jgi:8-amino-7-oxononanoate synthase